MKNLIFLTLFAVLVSCSSKVVFVPSPSEAEVTVDGKKQGYGQTDEFTVKKGDCLNIKVEHEGYLTHESKYCPSGTSFPWSKAHKRRIFLEKDKEMEYAIAHDYANKFFEQEVRSDLTEEQAWKVVSQVVMEYFDHLEMADRVTGYLKTNWEIETHEDVTIRTRIIVKQSGLDPLKYKLKIVSEQALNPDVSVKSNEEFKEWDKVLRKYAPVLEDFQSRLGLN